MVVIKSSTAGQPACFEDECIFSANDFVNILSQIKELKQVNVALVRPDKDGKLWLTVGDYQYQL